MPAPAPLHLAAEIGGPPHDDTGRLVRLARTAEEGLLDFVTLADSFGGPGPDALGALARIAPETGRIGLVPTVTTTHTEPFHVQAGVATLDWVSRGRAGWRVDVSTSAAENRLVGRREALGPEAAWAEAGEVAEVSRLLWDSWEDDAEIRDTSTGRFVDRDKLHYVDYRGTAFGIRGPSIVPRPPQGHPVTVVDASAAVSRDTAARHADVALLRARTAEEAAALGADLRARAAAHGRDPGALRILATLVVDLGDGPAASAPGGGHFGGSPAELADLIARWHAGGAVDGFHLVPLAPDTGLARLTGGTVAALRERGLFRDRYEDTTLRGHLRLARPASQYATTGGVS
ncbi:LLM class flavin-dependent oxidoreductase [Streptomyces zhihengii]